MKARVKQEYSTAYKAYKDLDGWRPAQTQGALKNMFLIERSDGVYILVPIDHFDFSELLALN